jgi:hypothetical protein
MFVLFWEDLFLACGVNKFVISDKGDLTFYLTLWSAW